MSKSPVAVSAPGKVLFAGGFLVLDRKHTGVVFGLNARIHARVEAWNDKPSSLKGTHILVQSPQFLEAKWLYRVGSSNTLDSSSSSPSEDVAFNVEQVPMTIEDEDDGGRMASTTTNKFVETTLRYVLTYVSSRGHQYVTMNNNIKITILADDDYYSQSPAASKSSATSPFTSFGVKLRDAHKTGLGSSAALVTSLVAAQLAFYLKENSNDVELPPQKDIHNLAQAAHCAAQGKVGSGFDVAAAVYGSCLYRRFTPAILEAVGEPSNPEFRDRLRLCVDDLELDHKWDVEVANHAVKIPDSLILVMCDVDCGSETPGMVRKVLQWRKEEAEEAGLLWNAIQQGSDDLCQELRRLSEVDGVVAGVEEDGFKGLGDILLTVRSLVREMSAKSEVPVEPPVITELLDYCTSLPGVVGGVAPGAGGYDAVALLIKNDVEVVRDLRKKLDGWKGQDDSGATIGHVRLLGVKQAKEGMRREDVGQYSEWV